MRKIAAIIALFVLTIAANAMGAEKSSALIKELEGFRGTVYLDTAGVKTIGYGFTSASIVGKGKISKAEALKELDGICKKIAADLNKELGRDNTLLPNEEAAVVSFIYNVGWGAFKRSNLCKLLKQGRRGAVVGCEFRKWIYARNKNGDLVVNKGLENRRAREVQMFLIGD